MEYYYQTVKSNENVAKANDAMVDGFAAWWLKILELSKGKEDWNVIIADQWIDNTGRVIGHIQRDNQAVGYDRGFRVALTVEQWVNQLNAAFDDDDEEQYELTLDVIHSEVELALLTSLTKPLVEDAMKALYKENSFTIHIAVRGYCDFDDGETMINILDVYDTM